MSPAAKASSSCVKRSDRPPEEPAWSHTLVWGGFFDHVRPPHPPDDWPAETRTIFTGWLNSDTHHLRPRDPDSSTTALRPLRRPAVSSNGVSARQPSAGGDILVFTKGIDSPTNISRKPDAVELIRSSPPIHLGPAAARVRRRHGRSPAHSRRRLRPRGQHLAGSTRRLLPETPPWS
jgi:hypothetical protein